MSTVSKGGRYATTAGGDRYLPTNYEAMHKEAEAPQYIESAVPEAPPAYALKSNFKIGYHTTPSPLVSPSQLQTHLNLLRAFKDLRTRIEQDTHNLPSAAASLDVEKRWVWFIELAVERCANV